MSADSVNMVEKLRVNLLTAGESLSPFYQKSLINENEYETFKRRLDKYIHNLHNSQSQNERSIISNILQPFLKNCGLNVESGDKLKGNSEIDLSVYLDSNTSSIENTKSKDSNKSLKAIFEAKKFENKNEMFSEKNVNCKALHEAILYYFIARFKGEMPRFVVITNFYDFYIFNGFPADRYNNDINNFESLFFDNKCFKNLKERCKGNLSINTDKFYSECKAILDSKSYLDSIKNKNDLLSQPQINAIFVSVDSNKLQNLDSKSLSPTLPPHFENAQPPKEPSHLQNLDSKNALPPLNNSQMPTRPPHFENALPPNFKNDRPQTDSKNIPNYKQLYRIFNEQFLCDTFNPNDANILNVRFYNELLYILGLSEKEEEGITKIVKSKESENKKGTLYYNIESSLIDSNKPHDLKDVIALIILWLNRILFLKLVETNLINFNKDYKLAFLNLQKITNFKDFSELFFKCLAKNYENRDDLKAKFQYLPYLNSSLFQKSDIESNSLDISNLKDNLKLDYYHATQVKDKNAKAKSGEVNFLEYLFTFLDSFDFGIEIMTKDGLMPDNKDLISSSALGLIFEKLNGYEDGSFYTPSFITSFMCREALESIVIERFTNEYKFKAKDFANLKDALKDKLDDSDDRITLKNEYKKILESIKICDPSVGSAHFLVSMLNEMINIYFKLGLCLNNALVFLNNDTLQIIDKTTGKNFIYEKPQNDRILNESQMQNLQKELFHLKQNIIENNLFGVDINNNSCEISRLRLWIELLKNSYYLESNTQKYHNLNTLPNIDINIKCGNSLIHRFNMQDSLKHIRNINEQIKTYKALVTEYKTGNTLRQTPINKADLESQIKKIQQSFTITLKNPKQKEKLESLIDAHIKSFGTFMLDNRSLLDGLQIHAANLFGNPTLNEQEQEAAAISFGKITLERKKLDSIESGEMYKDALEWRFCFPEVLDSKGDFEGFDIIIGNPPYIRQEKIRHLKDALSKYAIYNSTSDIFTYFFELGFNLLKPNGIFSMITSNKFCRANYGENLRAFLLNQTQILSYTELNGIKVFDAATVDVGILSYKKPSESSLRATAKQSIESTASKGGRVGIDKKDSIDSTNSKDNKDSIESKSESSLRGFEKAEAIHKNAKSSLRASAKQSIESTNTNIDCHESANADSRNDDNNKTFIYRQPKDINDLNTKLKDLETKLHLNLSEYLNEMILKTNTLSSKAFIFAPPAIHALKAKIESKGVPLKEWDISINYGIKTGYNPAFIITTATRDSILKQCDNTQKSLLPVTTNTFPSLRVSDSERSNPQDNKVDCHESANADSRNDKNIESKSRNDKNHILLNEYKRTKLLIKPILRGRDIKRYSYQWDNLWVINTHNGYKLDSNKKPPPIDINEYPALKNHLDRFYPQIAKRSDKGNTPYNLRNCAYLPLFDKEKIVYSEIVQKEPQFYLDNGDFKFGHFYAEATSFILSGENLRYLLGILNSKIVTFAFKTFYAGGGLGSAFRYKKAFLENLPIPKINAKQEKQITDIVNEILESKKQNQNTGALESKLDSIIYKLYDLNKDEIDQITLSLSLS
ncbi:Eco57I restriction-modification methylase domain-containing protein [Helicobacter saguini]|uniref:type IIG restriction enzyme/methyltransferase n=1 Tax=Helicobacter saguini TaxID=1548018 RepID=UPI001EE8E843|nr:Eco57I restriction-modification methylase domain-containing protein [Helicobacter saguini]